MHEGKCLCGTVHYRYHGSLDQLITCHCQQCRQVTGSAYASLLPAKAALIEWLSGQHELRYFESSPSKRRYFCQRCGSPIYSQLDSEPENIRLRAGSLITPLQKNCPDFHIFTDSKAEWDQILDGAPSYKGFKPLDA